MARRERMVNKRERVDVECIDCAYNSFCEEPLSTTTGIGPCFGS